jgi:hypothetical protein
MKLLPAPQHTVCYSPVNLTIHHVSFIMMIRRRTKWSVVQQSTPPPITAAHVFPAWEGLSQLYDLHRRSRFIPAHPCVLTYLDQGVSGPVSLERGEWTSELYLLAPFDILGLTLSAMTLRPGDPYRFARCPSTSM